MSTAKIEPLTRDNYDTWVIQAEAVLVRHKLWKYVETPLTPASTTDEKQNDKLAKSELILIIAPSELKQIKHCSTAKELWDKLKLKNGTEEFISKFLKSTEDVKYVLATNTSMIGSPATNLNIK